MSNILVTGATGQLGSAVIAHLLDKMPANQITALVRDEKKATDLIAKGINIKMGDYFDKESLQRAMQGISKVLLISSSDFKDRLGQHKNVIDAAKEAGVNHIFYTGVSMKDIDVSPLKPLLADHYQTEDYIKASGLTYTFLQNSLYAEVIPMFIGANVLTTGIYFPAGEGKVAFAARKDLAEATANILASEGHDNKTYHLSANTATSFAEIAATLSELSGKTVNYISPEPADFEAMLKQIGLPDGIILMSVLFAAGIKNNDFDATDNTLENFLGRKQSDLKSYLKVAFNL